MFFVRLFIFKVYTMFSHKKIVILRDSNAGYSFLYQNAQNADIVVKNNCDDNLCILDDSKTVEAGVEERTVSSGMKLFSIDLHSFFKSRVLNEREKFMVLNAFLYKDYDKMTPF